MWSWFWLTIFCLEALQGLQVSEAQASNKEELKFIAEVRQILEEQGYEILHQNLLIREAPDVVSNRLGRAVAEFDLVIRSREGSGVILVELKNQFQLHASSKKKRKSKRPETSTVRQLKRLVKYLQDSPFQDEKIVNVFIVSRFQPDDSIEEWKQRGLLFFTPKSLRLQTAL